LSSTLIVASTTIVFINTITTTITTTTAAVAEPAMGAHRTDQRSASAESDGRDVVRSRPGKRLGEEAAAHG
jgi:hypothetical protein